VTVPLLALVLGAGALGGCSSPPPPDIRVASVTLGTVDEDVQAPGNVAARATATVSSPATGSVLALLVRDGAHVAAGQPLLTVSSPSAQAALTSAQQADARAASSGSFSAPQISSGGLTAADAAAQQAFTSARAAAELIPDATTKAQVLAQVAAAEAQYGAARAAAQGAVDSANASLASVQAAARSLAEAQRAQTQAALAAAQATVDALTVRAPVAGTVIFGSGGSGTGSSGVSSLVSQLPASVQGQAQSLLGGSSSTPAPAVVGQLEPGTPVASGATLLTVTDVSALSVAATVDETDVLLVHPGVQADVQLDAVPGDTYPATVQSIDLAPTTSSRGGVSYVVRLSLGGGRTAAGTAAPSPRPGMSAVVVLHVLSVKDAVAVPAAAVFRDDAGDAVWVLDGTAAHRRDVTLGAQGDATIQVSSGLKVGDRIVVKGADQVTEGQQVP
jgi:multidrug efflux pump subunit AcrA (membrane-fusion protein)